MLLEEYIQFQKNTAVLMSKNNETQCALLSFISSIYFFLSSRHTTYAPTFILGKLFLEKTPLNLGL